MKISKENILIILGCSGVVLLGLYDTGSQQQFYERGFESMHMQWTKISSWLCALGFVFGKIFIEGVFFSLSSPNNWYERLIKYTIGIFILSLCTLAILITFFSRSADMTQSMINKGLDSSKLEADKIQGVNSISTFNSSRSKSQEALTRLKKSLTDLYRDRNAIEDSESDEYKSITNKINNTQKSINLENRNIKSIEKEMDKIDILSKEKVEVEIFSAFEAFSGVSARNTSMFMALYISLCLEIILIFCTKYLVISFGKASKGIKCINDYII